jgi:hypothetical protein
MYAGIVEKMIRFYKGSLHDIDHFLKVYAHAQTLGKLEGLDEKTLSVLEKAAIVHDIACPLCREKYGNAAGHYQEIESEALLRPFLAEFSLPEDELERIIYLISHHHTYTGVDGMDWQILVEADFLVNLFESSVKYQAILNAENNLFVTECGKRMLDVMFEEI